MKKQPRGWAAHEEGLFPEEEQPISILQQITKNNFWLNKVQPIGIANSFAFLLLSYCSYTNM